MRTVMDEYIALEVSLKEAAVSIRRDGKRVARKVRFGPSGARGVDPQACPRGEADGIRDWSAVGVVLSCADRGGPADNLHRRVPCKGGARHGGEQDGRQ